jgi:hypothetical protein
MVAKLLLGFVELLAAVIRERAWSSPIWIDPPS